MTVETVAAGRTVIDLGADATILDAARRVDAAESSDVVLVVPSGAPLTRNAVFLEALRRRAGDRRIVLVSSEARARSLASSVHMKAFASISALDRHELDATEHLSDARRAVMATRVKRASPRRGISRLRGLAVLISLLTAAGIMLAVVAPSATIVIAATPTPLGPFEYDLRAGPNGGDIRATTLFDDTLTAKTTGKPTGSRLDEERAAGVERFRNLTTNDIRIPAGTVVQTADAQPIRFATTEDKVLPRSTILPVPNVGEVLINIRAIEAGPKGNVAPDKITRGPNPEYLVNNPVATFGGRSDQVPVVLAVDYDKAVTQSDEAVRQAADQRLVVWKAAAPKDATVYGVIARRTGVLTPAGDIVGKELSTANPSFEISVTGSATAYQVSSLEPRATAIERLKQEVPPGMELDEKSVVVREVIGATVEADGVHWRVRAEAKQVPQANKPQMIAALAGRDYSEVGLLATQLGFKLVSITPWPEWWPRLPVLDSRITIDVESLPAASVP